MNPKDNLVNSLKPSVADKIRKQIAKERSISVEQVTSIDIATYIKHSPAKHVAFDAQVYRVSKRIEIAQKQTQTTVACSQTGVNIAVSIPRIPGFFLSYTSPLSEYNNCRKLAQRGYDYLQQLDTQVLAGILLVLADNYELFEFALTSSGIEKNAILRSCGKEELLKAILFIESSVHSNNCEKLPRLSFQLDGIEKQGQTEQRLHEWLKLLVSTLKLAKQTAPQKELEEVQQFQKHKGDYTYEKNLKKAERAAALLHKEQKKILLVQLETAVKYTRELYKESLISITLRNFLIKTFDVDAFPTIAAEFKAKIAIKLLSLPQDSRIEAIAKLLEQRTEQPVFDDFFSASPKAETFASQPVGSSLPPIASQSQQEEQEEQEEQEKQIEGSVYLGKTRIGEPAYAPVNLWNSMSKMQQLIYLKKAGISKA